MANLMTLQTEGCHSLAQRREVWAGLCWTDLLSVLAKPLVWNRGHGFH